MMEAGLEPQADSEPEPLTTGNRSRGARRWLARWWPQWGAIAWAHPRRLVASWAGTAAGLTLVDAAALALEARLGAREAAMRAVPGLAISLTIMHVDTFLHLGMNAPDVDTAPFETMGLPVVVTLLRRSIACFLWAHLIGRRPLASRRALAALLCAGAASDVVDGAVARRCGRTTRLGAYLDAEADFSFWMALVLTLDARRLLPHWLIAVLAWRFGAPVVMAAVSHFGLHRPVRVGSTIAGKAAAVAQLVACGAALRPRRTSRTSARAYAALHVVTAGFLLAAPLAQARRLLGTPRLEVSALPDEP